MGIASLGLHSTFLNSQQHTIKHEFPALEKAKKVTCCFKNKHMSKEEKIQCKISLEKSNSVDDKSTYVMRMWYVGVPAVLIFSDFLKYANS